MVQSQDAERVEGHCLLEDTNNERSPSIRAAASDNRRVGKRPIFLRIAALAVCINLAMLIPILWFVMKDKGDSYQLENIGKEVTTSENETLAALPVQQSPMDEMDLDTDPVFNESLIASAANDNETLGIFPLENATTILMSDENATLLEDLIANITFNATTSNGNLTLSLPVTTAPSTDDSRPLIELRLDPHWVKQVRQRQTTPMDPYVHNDCDFSNNFQPHVLSQCECSNAITILAEDVIDLYQELVENLWIPLYSYYSGNTTDDDGSHSILDDDHHQNNIIIPAITSCDAQNQALLWLASGDTRQASDNLVQRYVMAHLYMSLNGTQWSYQNLWLSGQNECLWLGLQCSKVPVWYDDNDDDEVLSQERQSQPTEWGIRITSLALDALPLFGTIPSELVFLPYLETLSITRSHLTGTIPSQLFSRGSPYLTDLRLYANQLTGSIPTEVGLATSLEVLKFENNWMYGTLVSELGLLTNLQSFSIGFNQFIRGLPSELGMWTKLTSLVLEDNRLSGTFPTTIGQWTSLEKLLMTENLLTGLLPTEVGLLTNLRDLRLADIGMHGSIPTELGLLVDLWRLDLGENHFNGTIVSELAQLTNLYFLALLDSKLSGTIPTEFGLIVNMTRLGLQGNHFQGTLPSEIGEMTRLKDFALDENDLTGTIPWEICELRTDYFLEKFIVDCPTQENRGVGTYCDESCAADGLLQLEGNCFTICRSASSE